MTKDQPDHSPPVFGNEFLRRFARLVVRCRVLVRHARILAVHEPVRFLTDWMSDRVHVPDLCAFADFIVAAGEVLMLAHLLLLLTVAAWQPAWQRAMQMI